MPGALAGAQRGVDEVVSQQKNMRLLDNSALIGAPPLVAGHINSSFHTLARTLVARRSARDT